MGQGPLLTYWDTSALVSLYTRQAFSARAGAHLPRYAGSVALTPLLEMELSNAFHLWVFCGEADMDQASAAASAHRQDCAAGIFANRPMPSDTYRRARALASVHTASLGVRSLDVLHVASALELAVDSFLSFDQRQCALARAEGLRVLQ